MIIRHHFAPYDNSKGHFRTLFGYAAATNLARLWQSPGKRQEAYGLLALVYEWFTEGFDTADLIEAKSLLDELSAEKEAPTV